MIWRRCLSLLLAALIFAPPGAMADVSNSDPQQALQLVDDYLKRTAEEKKQGTFDTLGRNTYIAQAIASRLLTLQPEDFNLFVFYFVDRYIHHPEQREGLFDFVKIVREMIKDDLANTARLNGGAADDAIRGSYQYGIWILLGGSLAWFLIMKSPLRTMSFIAKMQEGEMTLMRAGRWYRYGWKTATSVVIPGVSGGMLGLLLHHLEANKTHRLDPLEVLSVAQANLACQLSYDTLQAEQHLQKLTDDDTLMAKEGKPLNTQVKTLLDQVKVLQDQFPWLTGLRVSDPVFQKIIDEYPKASNWQDYKNRLAAQGASENGQCVQISLTHVGSKLQEMSDALDTLAPVDTIPAAPPAPKTEDLLKKKP